MKHGRSITKDEEGFVTIATIFAFVLLVSLASAGITYSALDLKSTTHYDTGNQAFTAAESGLLDAVSAINGSGVVNFQNDVVTRWSSVYGSGTKTMDGALGVQYQIAVATDAANPANRGVLTATGFAPLLAKRVLRVNVTRAGFSGAKGAIYLASDQVQSQFTGNAFSVDGNDHNTSGGLVPGGPVVPGIATHSSDAANTVTNSLNPTQKDNVKGLGFSVSPLAPSVMNTGGPTVDDLDQITANILSLPGVVTNATANFNGNQTFGSVAAPQITHLTAESVTLNGNAFGSGIIIADGSVTINGDLEFIGWILVRGNTIINNQGTEVTGSAIIQGSLWTGQLVIQVGGSAVVNYCEACLELADGLSEFGTMPRPITISSWQEVL